MTRLLVLSVALAAWAALFAEAAHRHRASTDLARTFVRISGFTLLAGLGLQLVARGA